METFKESYSFTPDNLFAGSTVDRKTSPETLLSAQGKLTRGTAVGRVTASGKLKILDSTNNDGSQKIWGILAEDTDATSADAACVVYLTGEFNASKIVFGGTDTVATHKVAAKEVGIHFEAVVSA